MIEINFINLFIILTGSYLITYKIVMFFYAKKELNEYLDYASENCQELQSFKIYLWRDQPHLYSNFHNVFADSLKKYKAVYISHNRDKNEIGVVKYGILILNYKVALYMLANNIKIEV